MFIYVSVPRVNSGRQKLKDKCLKASLLRVQDDENILENRNNLLTTLFFTSRHVTIEKKNTKNSRMLGKDAIIALLALAFGKVVKNCQTIWTSSTLMIDKFRPGQRPKFLIQFEKGAVLEGQTKKCN